MKRAQQITCISFAAFAVFTLISSFEYPYYDTVGPGPAFFPIWISALTLALSMALFIQITWGKSMANAEATFLPERQGMLRIMIILVALLGCLTLLDPLGFRISLFLFLFSLPLGLGAANRWVTLIFAAAGSFGIFHVFYYWLDLPLPMGMFGI